MPQAKTTKKKSASRVSGAKVGGGGVGTKKSKFNFKIMIPVVVLVAALGGFYIFKKSSAGSGNSFIRLAKDGQIGGGTRTTKTNGNIYTFNDKGGKLTSWLTVNEFINTTQTCVQFRLLKDAYVYVNSVSDPPPGIGGPGIPGTFFKSGTETYTCSNNYIGMDINKIRGAYAFVDTFDKAGNRIYSSILVSSIYGKY